MTDKEQPKHPDEANPEDAGPHKDSPGLPGSGLPGSGPPGSGRPGERFRRLMDEVEAEEDRLAQSYPDPADTRPVRTNAQDIPQPPGKSPEEQTPEGDPAQTRAFPPAELESGSQFGEPPAPGPAEPPVDPARTRTLPAEELASPPEQPTPPPASRETGGLRPARPAFEEEDTQPLRPPGTPVGGATPPPPPYGASRRRSPPALDANGMPLPRRVEEIDMDATRVSPAAYRSPTRRYAREQPAPPPAPPPYSPPPSYSAPYAQPASSGWNRSMGCLVRGVVILLFLVVISLLCGGSFIFIRYMQIARELPDVANLRANASQFETTRILDRNGNVLYEILDPQAGRRTYVPLERISPYLVAATIATEDKEFYSHPGFDVFAIARAFIQNYQSGETVSGASTITQQLARNLLFTPDERARRTYDRKIREAVLAAEITRVYSKDEILELYLNENYYGNLAYGVEAGAETYFGTTADRLTLGQATFLAGLPQAPSVYDAYTNRDLALQRQEDVLVLMYEASQEQGCIYVSNTPQRVCLDPVSAATAANEMRNYEFKSPDVQMRYPHWVVYITDLLETQFDAQTIYRSGFTVYTTLDPGLQEMAQDIVKQQVGALVDYHATNGALVAIQPATGEVLAMVGSADFYNEAISGQVNMAISPRQPGSSIKPVTYTAAFEKGWTPSTLIWDVPSEFPPSGLPDDPSPPYKPVNYGGRFHGPVLVREALANSYNMPAVKALDFVKIYDDPNTPQVDGFIEMARRLGLTTLTRPDYGLSLTLGGGEVTLLELAGAYATFANMGRRVPPVAITKILDHTGQVVYEYQRPPGEQVIRPEHAYLITSILSDNQARTPAFGPNSVLNLPFPVAAKTGTTNDFRDNWTLGYTPDLVVGVWVGNADYTPMQNTTGLTGAAPIWSEFMQAAIAQLTGNNPAQFSRPGGIVEQVVCALSGTLPSQWCPRQATEIFAADQPPLPKEEDLWQRLEVDTWTGLRASEACDEFTDERFVLNVTEQWARQWLRRDPEGEAWAESIGFKNPITFAPERACRDDDARPRLEISNPRDKAQIINSPIEIFGRADASRWFDYVWLEYGLGDDPVEWELLENWDDPIPEMRELYEWDLGEVDNGPLTLRLYMHSTEDTYAELRVQLENRVPTPTPTPTETPTPTLTPTPSPTPTLTPTPSPTATITPTPSETPHIPKATLTSSPVPSATKFLATLPVITLTPWP